MPEWLTPVNLAGPVSGLLISLFFCFQMLAKFEKVTEQLIGNFQDELKACNERYTQVFNELMRLKDRP